MNTVQAKRLNWGLEHDSKTHESYLFLITNQSEGIGKLLREDSIDCDYLLIKFEVPLALAKMDPDVDIKSSSTAKTLGPDDKDDIFARMGNRAMGSELAARQLEVLKDEKADLEQSLKEANGERDQVLAELDTANKSIYDKERNIKQFKRDIEYLETQLKLIKTQKQELIVSLTQKETELMNCEKRVENLTAELKKQEN